MRYTGNKFEFESDVRLGVGGMAEVYLGKRIDEPNSRAALKVPLPSLPDDVKALFLREAEAASAVSSPHIVGVIDWGDSPPFIAFEYVDGDTLGESIADRRAASTHWSESELIALFLQLVDGMEAVNERVIHRDIKPDNIFIEDGTVKISDFGISKYVGEVTRTQTLKGAGTYLYMAPETFKVDSQDWRSDQYSMGIVFYEMATFDLPFTGTKDELEAQHLFSRPSRVSSVRDDLSERFASVVARMLEKQQDQRFESWATIKGELVAIAESSPEGEEEIVAPNPLVAKAASQIDKVRSEALNRQQIRDEETRDLETRNNLVKYWADEFVAQIRERVDAINRDLGSDVILVNRMSLPGTLAEIECEVTFLNSRLRLVLGAVPRDESAEILAWGFARLRTPTRVGATNLLLLPKPEPYGSWLEVEMKILGSSSRNNVSAPGDFEVLGSGRMVLAMNSEGLLHQRSRRHVISHVTYDESPLDFKRMMDEWLEAFIDNASEERVE